MTPQQAIDAYFARGGTVTPCVAGAKTQPIVNRFGRMPHEKPRTRACWHARRGWHVVSIGVEKIAAAEQWLRARDISFFTNLYPVRGLYTVRVEDARMAVLFKLTWAGR